MAQGLQVCTAACRTDLHCVSIAAACLHGKRCFEGRRIKGEWLEVWRIHQLGPGRTIGLCAAVGQLDAGLLADLAQCAVYDPFAWLRSE